MKRFSNKLLCLSLVLLVLMLTIILYNGNSVVFAENQSNLSIEAYTDSDNLLNQDGSLSDKTIHDFAQTVKQTEHLGEVFDLEKVIPSEYLETTEEKASFYYSGKEYGFYIQKEEKNFDILIIDYYITPETSPANAEFTIGVDPILMQGFARYPKQYNQGYYWIKREPYYNFYVANPSFMSVLYNENELNYGDAGYSKINDNGLIIRQTRLNYGAVFTPESKRLEEFLVNIFYDVAATALPPGLSHIASAFKYLTEFASILIDDREILLNVGNENNIETKLTRTEQLNSPDLESFSRLAAVAPSDPILLSVDERSYAEVITMLNDSDRRSRLIQVCEFNILCKRTMTADEYVEENGEILTMRFSEEKTIYEDAQPEFDINQNLSSSDMIYLLPNGGYQLFNFTPLYSSEYSFDTIQGTTLTVDGRTGNTFYLTKGKKYVIKYTNNTTQTIISSLNCSVEQFDANKSYGVPENGGVLLEYLPSQSDHVKLNTSDPDVKITICDHDMKPISISFTNYEYVNFVNGEKYYIMLENTTNNESEVQILFEDLQSLQLDNVYDYDNVENVMSFTNVNNSPEYYIFKVMDAGSSIINILDDSGENLILSSSVSGDDVYYTVMLGQSESCTVVFEELSSASKVVVSKAESKCRWIIDGEIVESAIVKLKPNKEYYIACEISIDGITYELTDSLNISSGSGFSYSNSTRKLNIYDAENGLRIEFSTTYSFSYKLIIIVDDMLTKITLNHAGGTGYNGNINVELYAQIPRGIPKPTRPGYSFLGYYNKPQDDESDCIQYIDSNMVGGTWDLDVDSAVLYAHWKREVYTLTLCIGVHGEDVEECTGEGMFCKRYTMYYGDEMPIMEYAPEIEGYKFLGYYTGVNGTGEKYYTVSSALKDNRQAAQIYGYAHYYQEGIEYCYQENLWLRESNLILHSHWEVMTTIYYMDNVAYGQGVTTSTRLFLTHGENIKINKPSLQGEFKYYTLGDKQITTETFVWKPSLRYEPTTGEIVPTENLIVVYTPNQCIASGTLITLADGRQVPVESLTGDEMLLVWNMYTGTFDSAPILFIDSDPGQMYEVVNLHFSDGTVVKVISEHAFWDFDLNRYVYLRSDAHQYIGHWFNKQITNSDGNPYWTRVQLVDVVVQKEYTSAWSPVTCSHLCYYVNGMLSIPGGITGLFNIFEVDSETMMFDAEQMAADIAQYGLFTYEEFADLVPVSEEVFDTFNAQYFKVAIGKGLIDIEGIAKLAADYAEFF